MAESILLLIILLIIIAISIGFYLYTQQNTTDDKTFSEREQKIIDKATTNSQTIITNDISTKLDDGNYVKTDELITDRSDIQSNQAKIAEITDLRTTGDKSYTGTTSTGTTSTGTTSTGTTSTGEADGDGDGNGDISVGSYQYIMQDITEGSVEKIELKNKVNIANDFNICNENKSVCYKFKIDESDNLNIVKTHYDGEDIDGGKIYFKNAFELYNQHGATIQKYVEGPHPASFYIATPSALNDKSFETQKSVYDIMDLRKQFLISNAIAVNADDNEKSKAELDNDKQYYIKINTGDVHADNIQYHIMYPFSKLLQPILQYTDVGDKSSIKTLTMDYVKNELRDYIAVSDDILVDTIPTSTIQVNLNPKDDSEIQATLTVSIKYIQKKTEKSEKS